MSDRLGADPFVELPCTFRERTALPKAGIATPPWRAHHASGQLLYFPTRFSQTRILLRHHLVGIEFDPGVVRIQLNDGPMVDTIIKSSSFYFVPAGSTIEVRKEHACDFVLVTFDPDLMGDRFPLGDQAMMAEGMVDKPLSDLAIALRRQLMRGQDTQSVAERLAQTALEALARCRPAAAAAASPPLSPGRIRRALDFIGDHYARKITVEEIAQAVGGISPFHFAHTFKSTLRRSPHQYVLDHKLHQARDLLVHTATSLADIAYEVGFSSQAHMTETFSRKLGATPAQVRRAPNLSTLSP